ncbi:fecCD transport family protein [Burkholderia thailandensis MSMB121]|nr:fecCD transport family protein [Burkholderia thailandensis MSMB121]
MQRVVERCLRIVDRARSDDREPARIALLENRLHLPSASVDGHLDGSRERIAAAQRGGRRQPHADPLPRDARARPGHAAVRVQGDVLFVGTIGFVGPHIARLLVGDDHRYYLPGGMLAGAIMLSGASILSKTLISGLVLPIGIITALVGVPLFMTLISRRRRDGCSSSYACTGSR